MELPLKLELILPEDQCQTCLSIGRKLLPIGEFSQIYFKLLIEYDAEDPVQVCWECHKLLSNIDHFQNQARKAQELIRLRQNFIVGTLSNLSTVILNDAHIQNIAHEYGNNITHNPKKVKHQNDEDINDSIDENNQLSDNDLGNNYEMKKDELAMKFKKETLPNRTVSNGLIKLQAVRNAKKIFNKQAVKKGLERKQNNFRIILPNDINLGNMFKHFIISPEEVTIHLNKNRDSVNYKLQKYKCDSCAVTFKNEGGFIRHIQNKHRESHKYTCDMCKEKYSNKDMLTKHIIQHCIKYSCNTCALTSSDRNIMIRHYKKVFECFKCQLKFCTKRFFLQHHRRWHEQYICDTCGAQFKMRHGIERHLRTKHGPFTCGKCPKVFTNYGSIWYHHKTHHEVGPTSKPVYCVECNTHYPDKHQYRSHIAKTLIHNPPKRDERFPCSECDKRFSNKRYLKNHINFVHLQKYDYRCEECDKNFLRKDKLVQHRLKVHEGLQPLKNKMCNICGRGFSTNRTLTHHMRTHTGERPHVCALCHASFVQKSALYIHMRGVHSHSIHHHDDRAPNSNASNIESNE